jgi:hypothetical protein
MLFPTMAQATDPLTSYFTFSQGEFSSTGAAVDSSGDRTAPVAGDNFVISPGHLKMNGNYLSNLPYGLYCIDLVKADLKLNGLAVNDSSGNPVSLNVTTNGDYFQGVLVSPGSYTLNFHGSVSCGSSSSAAVATSIDSIIPIFTLVPSIQPRSAAIGNFQGPKWIKLSLAGDNDYMFKVAVRDPDHVLDQVIVEPNIDGVLYVTGQTNYQFDRKSNSKAWKKTVSGWLITVPLSLGSISPDQANDLPGIFKTTFTFLILDSILDSKFTKTSSGASKSIPITFRK